jgi:hypothetical protein
VVLRIIGGTGVGWLAVRTPDAAARKVPTGRCRRSADEVASGHEPAGESCFRVRCRAHLESSAAHFSLTWRLGTQRTPRRQTLVRAERIPGVRVEGKLPRIRDVLGTGQNVSDISGQPAYPALKVSAPQPLVMWAVVVDNRQVAPGQVRMPSSVRHLFGSKRWSTCSLDSTSPGLLAMAAVDGHVSASDISVPARADVLLHGGMPSGRKY